MSKAYTMVRTFPNGLGYEALKLYASDETALSGCKRLFRDAEPGEKLILLREDDREHVFTLTRPLAIGAPFQCDDCPQLKECTQYGCVRKAA